MSSSSPWLRIIQINDVYLLDQFPSFKTLIDEYRHGPDQCVVICAGDFLAPSLLSSLDKGASMIDIFNVIGMDYVCLGNHEADVGAPDLAQRIRQSQFVWINSNMPDLNDKIGLKDNNDNHHQLPKELEILTVGKNGSNQKKKKVVLLGLITEDPSLYRPDAFGGATIQPLLPRARELITSLKDQQVDLIVPLTHQGIAADRLMANEMDGTKIPLLLGGHDHEPYLETAQQGSCRIVKTGMDAQKAAVIDIRWNNNDIPIITVEMLDTADFAPDPVVQERVTAHKGILDELETAKLFAVADWLKHPSTTTSDSDKTTTPLPAFSTRNNRLGPSTGTTALCSMVRMGLRCQVALLNAGCVRAGKDYDHHAHFTWADLKAEMPFATPLCVCKIPGKVLQDTIQHSRRCAPQGIAKGGYLHASQTTICNEDGTIQSILGEAFDPEREYLTAFPYSFLDGIDNHQPLLDWAATRDQTTELPSKHTTVPAKLVSVELLSALFWLRLGSFEEVAGDDGVICKNDLREHMKKIYGGNVEIANLMVDNVFGVADRDNDGTISALEQIIVRFVARDMLNHIVTSDELQMMKTVVSRVMESSRDGKENDDDDETVDEMVTKLLQSLDLQGNGSVQREEILRALGNVANKDLLK
ncbi:5'-nucleotidase [Seminavis robusta]|uniref:5'-nucleotidase n=1 Tax=Seminavis robusta TaxID=568900 RepID=A0A9N8H3P5_9STRA|nr:5'-nucleotidase [Seminavis robusta]|eukprot:Sro31_g020110.1 5'-nucleotidase (643) ;mRNA; r:35263-37191